MELICQLTMSHIQCDYWMVTSPFKKMGDADIVELVLPMPARKVVAHENVKEI